VVKLINVSYRYPSSQGAGVDGITFEVNSADFILLVGRTGAGKTTLIRLLARELIPDAGEIILHQHRSLNLRRRRLPEWRRCLGIMFQDFHLLLDRSAYDNVLLTAICERRLPEKPRLRAIKALNSVGLTAKIDEFPRRLSTGEQQRVALARAIVNEPFVLLADEPVSNLDQQTSAEIIEVLRRINRAGTAVVTATHQPERFEVCRPRILRLENGRLVNG